ncbi:MAG: trigger factor [Patescibacteria group bacterium]|nr:trigger factor [Patescibacteria group bacterium]
MKVEKLSSKQGSVSLKIILDKKEWDAALDKAAAKLSEQEKIEGFRAGKAPLQVVMAKVGEARVLSVAIEDAINLHYPTAVKETDIKPVALPKVAVDKASPNDPLEFTAEVAVLPEVALGDYTKIKVKKVVDPVEETQVDKVLEDMRKRAAEFNEVERPLKKGDWAEIDFAGTIEGKPFEGGASKNHPLIVGDGMFIPGFEEGMEGMKAGEDKDVEVTFPADYHKQDLAGKKAMFNIKLHKVKAVNYPDIDDAFAKKMSRFETLQEFRDDVRKFITEQNEQRADEKAKEEAILALAKQAKVDIPKELVDQELNAMVHDLKHQVEHQKMDFEEYLKRGGVQNEEGLKSQWREQAEQRVRAGLALDAFKKAEGITATEDEIKEEIQKLKTMYPQDADKIEEEYGKPVSRDRLKNVIASRKAIDRLLEVATA